MSLAGTLQAASPGLIGFDSDTAIASDVARQFAAQGFHFCLRYVSQGPQPPSDLSIGEANAILDAGLALMPVQHAHLPNWQPTRSLGDSDGAFATRNSHLIGFPPGVNVWCDLEGIASGARADDVIAYCNAWYAAVKTGGYLPGLYVGYDTQLNAQQLGSLKFQAYWRSQSVVPNVAGRGFQLLQLYPSVTRNGIKIDFDVTQNDYKDGQAHWLVRKSQRLPTAADKARRKGRRRT